MPNVPLCQEGDVSCLYAMHLVGADDFAQLFATKERYRCGMPLAGTVRPSLQFSAAPCRGRCPHRPASAILHRTSCRGGRPCPPVPAAADKSKIDASLRASAHTCPASYRGVCRARVPYAPGCRGNPVDFLGVSWDACRGRCPHQPAFLNPFFSFSLRKKRTGSIFQEKKEGIQNRKRIPCRHHVTTH